MKKAREDLEPFLTFAPRISLLYRARRLREISLAMRQSNFLLFEFGIGDLNFDLSIRSIQSAIRRFVCDQILRSHLFLDLLERLSQFRFILWKICAAAGTFGDLCQRSLINSIVEVVTDTDRVDHGFGTLSGLNRLVQFFLAERVVTVGKKNDRTSRFFRSRPQHIR